MMISKLRHDTQALAIYEKEPESAKATPELIRENLFKNQFAQALLAFEGTQSNEGKAVGLALYFFSFVFI